MAIYWQCICEKRPKWSLKNLTCPKCGRVRDKIQDVDYWLEYRFGNGKKQREKAKNLTLRQAEKLLSKRENEIAEGTFFHARSSGYERLQDLIDKYRTKVRVDTPGFVSYATKFTDRMVQFFGNPKFQAITAPQIEDWKIHLRDKENLAEATVNKHLACGKAVWNYCVPDLPNPWRRVKCYRLTNQLTRFLTEEQEQKVLQHAYENYHDLFEMLVVAITTGLRRSNVLRLRRSEVNWDTGWITVIQKGRRVHNAPLTDLCREILARIPSNGTEWFWVSTYRGPGYMKPHGQCAKRFKKCLRAAGVNPDEFRWHDLRHHAATRVVREVGLLGTQAFLGHADIRHTLRYAHLEQKAFVNGVNEVSVQVPEDLQKAIGKVVPFKKVG